VKAQGLIVLAGLLLGLAATQGVVLTVLAVASVRRARGARQVGPSPRRRPPWGRPSGARDRRAGGGVVGRSGRLRERWPRGRPGRAVAAAPAADKATAPLLGGVLRYCLPLLGARAAFLSGQNLSRVVLGAFMSLEDLGYFSFAFTVVDRFVGFLLRDPLVAPALVHAAGGARRPRALPHALRQGLPPRRHRRGRPRGRPLPICARADRGGGGAPSTCPRSPCSRSSAWCRGRAPPSSRSPWRSTPCSRRGASCAWRCSSWRPRSAPTCCSSRCSGCSAPPMPRSPAPPCRWPRRCSSSGAASRPRGPAGW